MTNITKLVLIFVICDFRALEDVCECIIHCKFVLPSYLIIVGAMTVCFHYSILFMKLWSYVQVNMWCRHSIKEYSSKTRSRSQSISVAELRELAMHFCFNRMMIITMKYYTFFSRNRGGAQWRLLIGIA